MQFESLPLSQTRYVCVVVCVCIHVKIYLHIYTYVLMHIDMYACRERETARDDLNTTDDLIISIQRPTLPHFQDSFQRASHSQHRLVSRCVGGGDQTRSNRNTIECTESRTYVYAYTYTSTYLHTYLLYIHACINTHTHTHIHA